MCLIALTRHVRRLRRSVSGVAMIEFAVSLPILLLVGLAGVETANFALVNMRVAQLAAHIADNASRIGDTSTLENRRIYESDINDIFNGANIQAGGIDFFAHGRAIISSLEVDPDSGNQYIHWQRCKGGKAFSSAYGEAGDGTDGALNEGLGPVGQKVQAIEDEAVIYVELSYTYQPLISAWGAVAREIRSESSFMVRDSRDLSQIYQRDAGNPDPVAACA